MQTSEKHCPCISTSASSRSPAGPRRKPKALDVSTAVGLWAGAKQGHQSTGQLHRCLRSHLRSHFYTPCAQPSTIPGRRVCDQQAKGCGCSHWAVKWEHILLGMHWCPSELGAAGTPLGHPFPAKDTGVPPPPQLFINYFKERNTNNRNRLMKVSERVQPGSLNL